MQSHHGVCNAALWQVYEDYRLVVLWLALADTMAWLEQKKNHDEGKPLFSVTASQRMTQLAPIIASNLAETVMRHNSIELLRGLVGSSSSGGAGGAGGDDAGAASVGASGAGGGAGAQQ